MHRVTPRRTARALARRLAQRIGWLPVLGPGVVPACPPGWRIGAPDFVGVGIQKAGTTWWYSLIEAHPDVAERREKELHFFADFWRRPFRDDDAREYHRYFPRPEGKLSGEWTPRYVFDFWTPPLLRRAAPHAKILVLLRDPVERYASGLTVSLGTGAPPFHPAVAQEAMARGRYHEQLTHLLQSFPREQVLVLQYERCTRDLRNELARTFRFIGLDPEYIPPGAENRVNPTSNRVGLPAEMIERLRALYRQDVERLAREFPEVDLSLWPHFSELRSEDEGPAPPSV